MMKKSFLALAVAIAVAGCSSVKLDDVPVENKNPTGVTQPPATQSQVAPVVSDAVEGSKDGPQNVARLIYFDFDSYVVKPEFQSLLDAHAKFMKANPNRRVAIEGHTDDRGGREYNLALGQRRSEAVRRALGLLGVSDNQIEAVSFGKEKPAAPGSDEAAWAKNRRAEIVYR
ncbi:peptidoglycan-associated lipoprotein Pal [Ramlibacter solisilvae]|uniref:Peptidoglycan-associated lipoprotein n=1 Tax=Ramlibacter tataouinensis TaxID=94132 RepID=A0A127JYX3_9BURK|nr:peptidoglycan-associated lipoprotein Pal [Ramlibacter tataouinensis]AMO25124.1 peptidoglycan-binding protein [Ramlibacter tataouinensis]